VKEKSKLPIEVNFDKGINKWSGMTDLALEFGILTNPSKGWYSRFDDETKKYRWDDISESDEFWESIFSTTNFKQKLKEKFKLGESHATRKEK
jgi:hypothetical protein